MCVVRQIDAKQAWDYVFKSNFLSARIWTTQCTIWFQISFIEIGKVTHISPAQLKLEYLILCIEVHLRLLMLIDFELK